MAGTTEARQLAERLAPRSDLAIILSLAGRTRSPSPLPAPTRVGGFGGVDGLIAYLRAEAIELLIDATHPFANRISRNAVLATERLGLPLLRLERPAWQPMAGDRWTSVQLIEEAVGMLGPEPRRVLLATGRQEANAVAAAPQHHYFVRSVDPVDPPLAVPHVEYLLARGPFDVEAEEALFRTNRIDVIVCKNSGGDATYAKLAAARALGLEVVMIERITTDVAVKAGSVDEALPLIDHLLASAAKRGV